MFYIALLNACTAVLNIQSNTPDSTVYVTDYAPSAESAPTIYEATGTAPYTCEINYFAWEQYYVWVGVPGKRGQVQQIPNEVKPAPLVGAICCFLPMAIWAYGPTETPIYVSLPTASLPNDNRPLAVYSDDGEQAGWCYPDNPDDQSEL